MLLSKLKTKSLISTDDLSFNRKLGLPVEVFCPKTNTTLAFGQISSMSHSAITIQETNYSRTEYVFFGHPYSPPKIKFSPY